MLTLFILYASQGIHAQNLPEFPDWLEGLWEISHYDGTSYEQWQKIDKNILHGKTYRVFGSDTILFSNMEIKAIKNKIILEIINPYNTQNNTILYYLEKQHSETWTFKTKTDAFPTKINYSRISPNSAHMWTEPISEFQICVDFLMQKNNEQ
jgi:hypothetical protein